MKCFKLFFSPAGLLESPGMSHAESLTIANIMEAIRTQVGTVYPQDAQ